MSVYIMSHRTQITLEDAQYERLREESRRTGLGLAELIRRAVDGTYGTTGSRATLEALADSFAAWGARDTDGAAYVEGLRRGLNRRLAQ